MALRVHEGEDGRGVSTAQARGLRLAVSFEGCREHPLYYMDTIDLHYMKGRILNMILKGKLLIWRNKRWGTGALQDQS